MEYCYRRFTFYSSNTNERIDSIFNQYFNIENDLKEFKDELKDIIGEEKVRLYDSYATVDFVKKIQNYIHDDSCLKASKIYYSLYFTNKSLYRNHDEVYFKVINKDEGNHGFFYKDNQLNFDTKTFYPAEECTPGGLYSCRFNKVNHFISYTGGSHILPVIIPYGVPSYTESFKQKSPVLYALTSIPIHSPDFNYLSIVCNNLHNYHDIKRQYWFEDRYLYSNKNETNQKILTIINQCILSRKKSNKVYFEINSSIYYWNRVKTMIHDNNYKELYRRILLPKENHFKLIRFERVESFDKLNVSELFYVFNSKKDGSLVEYLKNYLFPKLIKENEDNNIRFNYDFDLEKIGEKLQKMIKKPLFFELLKLFNGIISGSILLEILMISNKNKMKSNDIDIYFTYSNFLPVLNFLIKNQIYYESYREKKNSYHMKGVQQIITINNELFCDKSVQLIFVDNEDPCQFIFDNFDFDSCMNCYSFKDNILISRHPSVFQLHQMTISDKYIHKIFVDKDNYSTYRAAKTIDRSIKYIQRGFKITNLDAFLNDILSNI